MAARSVACGLALMSRRLAGVALAADQAGFDRPTSVYAKSVDRAIAFLRRTRRRPTARWRRRGNAGPGVTAVVTDAILSRVGRSPDDPLVAKSLKYLEGFVQPDGAVSPKKSTFATTKPRWR